MKKMIAWSLAVMLLLSLCACNSHKTDDPDETKPQSGEQQGQTGTGETTEQQNNGNANQALTVDAVMAAPETSADEFEYDVTEEGVEISGYNGDGGIVVIPEKIEGANVILIKKSAFANKETITAVRLPDTVREVGNDAFVNCAALEIFISGDGLVRLGEYTFNACIKLSTVRLNNGIEVLDDMCFAGTALTELELPNSVKEINYAFEGKSKDEPFVVIGEAGSFAEQYVNEYGENCSLVFRAK